MFVNKFNKTRTARIFSWYFVFGLTLQGFLYSHLDVILQEAFLISDKPETVINKLLIHMGLLKVCYFAQYFGLLFCFESLFDSSSRSVVDLLDIRGGERREIFLARIFLSSDVCRIFFTVYLEAACAGFFYKFYTFLYIPCSCRNVVSFSRCLHEYFLEICQPPLSSVYLTVHP